MAEFRNQHIWVLDCCTECGKVDSTGEIFPIGVSFASGFRLNMVQSLTFIDCSSCGKRIRSNALKCHHCHEENVPTNSSSWAQPENAQKVLSKSRNQADESHMALEHGGYDDTDDFDYDEYLAEEFPNPAARKWRVKPWVWITAWLLIFATLLPYLYYALMLAQ